MEMENGFGRVYFARSLGTTCKNDKSVQRYFFKFLLPTLNTTHLMNKTLKKVFLVFNWNDLPKE